MKRLLSAVLFSAVCLAAVPHALLPTAPDARQEATEARRKEYTL
jgi:hypothetical protein